MHRFHDKKLRTAACLAAWMGMSLPAMTWAQSGPADETPADQAPADQVPADQAPADTTAPEPGAPAAPEPAAPAAPEPAAPAAPEPAPAAPEPAPASDGVITGTVVSETSGTPLAGATVTVAGTASAAVTDENGSFTLSGVAPGTHTVEVALMGYLGSTAEVAVVAGQTAEATVQLPDDPQYSEVILIVGSRTERTVTKTPVPVDIITAEQIQESGQTETNQILSMVVPSYQANHQTVSDGSDHVNPASLRGLGPDQVLVLVNGKRRHSSALVHSTDTFGRGTVGVDLNAIPTSAIERIEVLRDGAAAQYGSDAIAGVVNIVLKDQADVFEATARSGITASGDGFELKVGANQGMRLGRGGSLNLSAEFLQRNPTDRSRAWTGPVFADLNDDPLQDGFSQADYDEATRRLAEAGLDRDDVSMRIGQGRATMGAVMFNAELPVASSRLYSFGGVTYRDGEAAGFYRLPEEEDRVDPEEYPFGFLPEIHTRILDWSLAVGARAQLAGLDVDLSASHGGNMFLFGVQNSVNASLGADVGGTSFDAGGQLFNQTSLNADVVKALSVPAFDKLSLVGGAELRVENFRIMAGEEASYIAGPETTPDGTPKVPGAQVFPGYQPESELSEYRTAVGAYAGAESELNERVLVDLGGRFENYSDFGSTVIGKLATRVNVVEQLALRGAVSTGFRAPSLHQVWFNTVSTQFQADPVTGTQAPRQVLTANNRSPVAEAFGVPRLEEETSFNLSTGFTARLLRNLSLTADFYRITIDDRIVLSSRFSSDIDGVEDVLAPFPGVSEVEFFLNAVDTETMGADVVLDYTLPVGSGSLGVTGSANFTRTRLVGQAKVPETMAERIGGGDLDAVRDTIFNRMSKNQLEDLLPRRKGALAVRYGRGPITVLTRASYFGPSIFRGLEPAQEEEFDQKVLFDLDLGYRLSPEFRVSLGGTNIFNTFPDEQTKEYNRYYDQFVYRPDQFGMNGAFYYLNLQYTR